MSVVVSSPEGLPIDGVTVTNEIEARCDIWSSTDAGANAVYTCWEQGEGTYTVRVTSGSMTWTKSVELESDGCHVTDQRTVAFVLEARTAD